MNSIVSRLQGLVEGREARIAYGVAGLVVLACWALILLSGQMMKSLDERDFLNIAQNLARTGIFAEVPGEPTAYRAPGLVFFLLPFVKLGAGLVEARLINALLVGLSLILLFHLIRRHVSAFAGLLSTLLVPLWPVVIYAASTLYPQTLAAFLLLLTLLLLDPLRDGRLLRPSILGGIAFGALILTVPIVLLLTPIFVLWVALIARRKIPAILLFGCISASIVGSWSVRNYLVFDAFVPVASSSGFNLLAGNTAEARWNTSLTVKFPDHVYTALGNSSSEIERNDIMTHAALEEIRADPARFVQLYAGKFLHWFHFSNKLLSDQVLSDSASRVSVSSREIILLCSYLLVIVGPLLCRLALLRTIPMRQIELLFICLWIAAGLAYALFFTRVRFRLPFDWLLISSNAIFLAGLLQHYTKRRKPE